MLKNILFSKYYNSYQKPLANSNQIFHYTRCITQKRVTSLRDPCPHHCARATQLISSKCFSCGEPLGTLRPIWLARDLDLRSPAQETNALPLDGSIARRSVADVRKYFGLQTCCISSTTINFANWLFLLNVDCSLMHSNDEQYLAIFYYKLSFSSEAKINSFLILRLPCNALCSFTFRSQSVG